MFLSVKRKGRGRGLGGMITMVDEVFAPTKHEAALAADRETRLPAPAPQPGDGDRGISRGRIILDLQAGEESRR